MELGHQFVEGAVTLGDQALTPLLQPVQAGIHGGVTHLDDGEGFLDLLYIPAAHQAADELQVAAEGFVLLGFELAAQLDGFGQLFIQRDPFQLAVAQGDDLGPQFLQCLGVALELALAGTPIVQFVVVLILTHRSLIPVIRVGGYVTSFSRWAQGSDMLSPFPSFIQM
ncbi:hypothetical protein D3C72_1220130 [compost metagenome]